MSQTGACSSLNHTLTSTLAANPNRRRPGWIARNRAALEATATLALAMSAPVLTAVATLQAG